MKEIEGWDLLEILLTQQAHLVFALTKEAQAEKLVILVHLLCKGVMSADVARGHGDDGGGDDHPPPHQIPTGCGGCLGNRGKGSQKPNFGGRRAGRMHTRQETRNLELKSITDKNGPVQSIYKRSYKARRALLRKRYWIPDSDGTYNLKRIRQTRPSYISEVDWDAQIAFWNDPKNLARAAQNKKNGQRARSYADRDPGAEESSATREYPSLIHTFFLTHTVLRRILEP
ncbi:hypothetical protein Tco_0459654 [Tanacetum coccineum]